MENKKEEIKIVEGYIPYLGYQTYYRIVNPDGKKTPLLLLHGGPGSTHNSYELLDHMAKEDDRPLIMYDQIGCGLSSIETGHQELWNKETWANEVNVVREYLHLDKVHLLGHSWGGMLAIIYLCDYNPKGIQSAILSSTLSSASLWQQETHRLIGLLSKHNQKVLLEAERSGKWDDEKTARAVNVYVNAYITSGYKKNKDPECMTREKKTPSSKESYLTAWGPSEFSPNGTLKDYEYTDKLSTIKCPVLLCNGNNDESTPYQNKVMFDHLTCEKQWIIYQHSRHITIYQEHDLYVKNLVKFLNEHD